MPKYGNRCYSKGLPFNAYKNKKAYFVFLVTDITNLELEKMNPFFQNFLFQINQAMNIKLNIPTN